MDHLIGDLQQLLSPDGNLVCKAVPDPAGPLGWTRTSCRLAKTAFISNCPLPFKISRSLELRERLRQKLQQTLGLRLRIPQPRRLHQPLQKRSPR